MKMRSYQTVLLLLARHSKRYSGFNLVKKIALKYGHADEYKISLMLKDLNVLHYDNDGIEYDWERVAELMEMAINE